ncbi:MAG: hypothetical protein JSV52_07860 [Candidatus Zixiibacteriota bacterium]|nr:MAG: hypothetical protein JSV52_07860 [candidate division Zixibacteria bacterium]
MTKNSKQALASIIAVACLCLAIVLAPVPHQAQDVASGQATANVLTGLSVTSTQALNFGDVLQGVAKSVPNNDAANSGIFVVTGEPSAGISVYIALPPYLATATGDDRMNIVFGVTDCSIDSTGNSNPSTFGDGWPNVDPYALPNNLVIGSAAPSQTAVFLGGEVVPSVDQTAGPYTGEIVITVAYNGT